MERNKSVNQGRSDWEAEKLTTAMQLEMLVDGELPEAQRCAMLKSLDNTPERWRELGMRFLERQVERQAVKELIGPAEHEANGRRKTAIPATYSFRTWAGPSWRSMAAMVIVGALCAAGGIWYGMHGNATESRDVANGAETIKTVLPAEAMAGVGDKPMEVSVQVKPGEMPVGYTLPATSGGDDGRHDVVIMPHGKDRAVIFPVTMVRPANIY